MCTVWSWLCQDHIPTLLIGLCSHCTTCPRIWWLQSTLISWQRTLISNISARHPVHTVLFWQPHRPQIGYLHHREERMEQTTVAAKEWHHTAACSLPCSLQGNVRSSSSALLLSAFGCFWFRNSKAIISHRC